MCNLLHDDSTPIPQKGIGYKLFAVVEEQQCTLTTESKYLIDDDGITRWYGYSNEYIVRGGFCFLLDRRTAIKAYREWTETPSNGNIKLFEIEYSQGIGTHIEHLFVLKPMKIALCRAWKVTKEIKVPKRRLKKYCSRNLKLPGQVTRCYIV